MTWERFFDDVLPILLPVISALLTLWLSQMHSRRSARDQREFESAAAATTRSFDARQNRYDDRRDAVITFLVAVQKEDDAIDAFHREPEYTGLDPVDVAEDYKFTELNAAHARISLLGDREVVAAADKVVAAIRAAFTGESGAWKKLEEARSALILSARKMLVSDADQNA